ncbi:hypothetical protein [Chryseobacterium sp.]|uniref:hypothetical protein n=1 Tax=Chryseobacterium sp. TaxID=1871047 RepID=UPI0024E1CFA5|nr:hypothetical protein [Chryseobacterium sp.]
MRLNILKTKIAVGISIICFFSGCKKKSDLENQIIIKINAIDNKTKQPRANTFDTIEIKRESAGYLTKTFDKIEERVTDSSGSIKIKIDCTKGYKFLLRKKKFYGSESFGEPFNREKLKDGQEVNIEVMSLENYK